jgi:hypothetical protein
MKRQWLAYVIVGLLAIGAGVAIAGLPDTSPAAATITPSTSVVPDTTTPETSAPESTVPPTTEPETTEPETTVPETTEPSTTVPDTTDSVPAELPDRSELNVAAANGANIAGAALRMTVRLEAIGYVDVASLNGTDIVALTTVYYAVGFEEAALRLADDLDLLDSFVAPIENAPEVDALPADTELLVYIGADRA